MCFYLLGLYGVGKAADHPPALVVLSHKPEGATRTIAWVGKGIVYDTGGLSIKSKVSHYVLGVQKYQSATRAFPNKTHVGCFYPNGSKFGSSLMGMICS